MSLLQATLRRIAIRNLDKGITTTFKNVINSSDANKIKDYIPKIPKWSDLLKTIIGAPIMIIGSNVIMGIIWLILLIFLSKIVALLIAIILITIFLITIILTEISIKEIPDIKSEPFYIIDNRYNTGKKFLRNVNVPNNEVKIQLTKNQRLINIIITCINWIPSIISFWVIYILIK
jgi:ABC-type multidrug transport system fused ATPase/permease subunit